MTYGIAEIKPATFDGATSFECDLQVTDTPRSNAPASGYGSKIPTRYMVRVNGKWRRVYAACFGNAGSLYVGKPGAWQYVVESVTRA